MPTAYNTTLQYNSGVTYYGATAADKPVVMVEIDTKSTNFTLTEGQALVGSLAYDSGNAYNSGFSYAGDTPFVDITSSVRNIEITRGRSSLTYDHFDAGTCVIELADFDSSFLPGNTASIHYPRVTAMRPVRISATWSGATTRLYRGYVDRWDISWEPRQSYADVRITATDLTKVLNKLDTEVAGADGDSPKTRIDAMLDVHNIPQDFRVLDTGTVTLLEDTTERRPLWGTLQDIETAESGALYIDGQGRVVFRDRNDATPSGTGTVITDASSSAVTYSAVDVAIDDEQLYNFVSVTIAGIGTEQTAGDTSSEEQFQRRSLILTDVLLETDAQALSLAQHLLATRKTPALRVEAVTIPTLVSTYNAYAATQLDLLDPITVVRSAPSYTSTTALFIVGVRHSITPTSWETTLTTQNQSV